MLLIMKSTCSAQLHAVGRTCMYFGAGFKTCMLAASKSQSLSGILCTKMDTHSTGRKTALFRCLWKVVEITHRLYQNPSLSVLPSRGWYLRVNLIFLCYLLGFVHIIWCPPRFWFVLHACCEQRLNSMYLAIRNSSGDPMNRSLTCRACIWTLCYEAFPLSGLKDKLVHNGGEQLTVILATKDKGLLYNGSLLRPLNAKGVAEATFTVNEPESAHLPSKLPPCLFRLWISHPLHNSWG